MQVSETSDLKELSKQQKRLVAMSQSIDVQNLRTAAVGPEVLTQVGHWPAATKPYPIPTFTIIGQRGMFL